MSAQSAIYNPTNTTSAASGDGFSTPRLTTTGRLAISFGTTDKGMMVYDTTLNNLFIWNGSAWESVPASGDAGANGSVQYNDNGVVSGAVNFVWDSTNNRVGIGTATPVNTLEVVAPAGDNIVSTFRSGDATAANNAGGGFRSISSATAANRVAQVWLDADGANFSGGDYFFIQKNGGSGTVEFNQSSNAAMVFLTNSTERMRIDSSGNLGLGVTPSAWATTFNVKAFQTAGGSLFNFSNTVISLTQNSFYNTSGGYSYANNGFASEYYQMDGKHIWRTAASGTAGNAVTFTQAMTLTAGGNLLVGTTTDIASIRMQVWSSQSDNTAYLRNSNATPYGLSIRYTAATPNNTGSEFLYCEDTTALRASIRSNGGIANYQANDVSLSDSRLKTDIKPLASYWDKIKSLELVTFKYKDQTHSDDNIGLIAQQVESVAPELVDVDGFGETPSDGVPIKTIYTTDLYHAAIKALQEAMARIEALESKLA